MVLELEGTGDFLGLIGTPQGISSMRWALGTHRIRVFARRMLRGRASQWQLPHGVPWGLNLSAYLSTVFPSVLFVLMTVT